ncbi:tyrosine-type recombinase/integrase [Rhodococcus sp. MEB064]|uniref:tyrosine-type recombinase/integrase n=1 Tax=Rhodococcus sp. MEB064 TaxID=1587522 RepID=UPI0005ACCC55|nr:site-specific integrase [Rhodococcus sp. MEB064]KIQ19822.1 recombinase XerD [Rhodococcus sp. MEB064]
MTRQQLPPQIKKLQVQERGTAAPVTRYQVTVDAGVNSLTGRRQQVRRRYRTEREARAALAEIGHQATTGQFVAKSTVTVKALCDNYVAGKHRLRETSRSKLLYDLAPLIERHGAMLAQRLRKEHVDQLVTDLRSGGTHTAKGRVRRPWGSAAVNKFVSTVSQVLGDAARQGLVPRNVAEHVDRVEQDSEGIETYTEAEVSDLLSAITGDRLAHAWELALSGLRRGEVAGLRWADVDLDAGILRVTNNRVSAGGRTVENAPKSAASARELPMPERMVAVLRAGRARQAKERLALGRAGGDWEYVVSNEAGSPYSPAVLSRYWRDTVKGAGIRHIKLHAARHTCATLMHLQGVPVALIAAWIGHKDASLTMRVYAHSQNEALKVAAASLNRVVTPRDTGTE